MEQKSPPSSKLGNHEPNSNGIEAVRGFAFVFSFSGYFIIDPLEKIPALDFSFEGNDFTLNPPIRLAHTTWRPIPQLDTSACIRIFKNDLKPLPLQISVFPVLEIEEGISLRSCTGRGEDYDPSFPPDTLILVAHGVNHEFEVHSLESKIIQPMIVWLRVLTGQWWIARSTEKQTGNLHFSFALDSNRKVGDFFIPRCRQTTASDDTKNMNSEMWIAALKNSIEGKLPNWSDVLMGDIAYYRSNREYITALLLTCGWIESEIDGIFSRKKVSRSAMNVGRTDILKQLSKGFEKVFGRNLANEMPEEFGFVKSLWISRGDFAHGKPFKWEMGGNDDIVLYRAYQDHVDKIRGWFMSI